MRRDKRVRVDGDLVFQLLSWSALDCDYGDSGDEECEGGDEGRYLVKVYGCTEQGKSVSLNILNFTPFFYIRVDHRFNMRFTHDLHAFIVSKLPWNLKNSLVSVKLMKRKDFWGFTNFMDFNFARITFKSLRGFRAGARIFNSDVKIAGVHSYPLKYKLYESNIEPFLRLIHIRELQPTGWCRVPAGKHSPNSGLLMSNCQIDVECDWKLIEPFENDRIAPFVVASFDIECTSSHGDFPVAKKDYKKVANDLVNWFFENKDMDTDTAKMTVAEELCAIFTEAGGCHLSRVYPKEPPNMEAISRAVSRHIDDIMNTLSGRIVYKAEEKKVTRENIVHDLARKFGTFEVTIDRERREIERWSGIFPLLEGDGVIQVGTTVHVYGEKHCCYKSIITLGTCDPIEGVDVVQCETEEDLLLKWRDLIVTMDPDVLIGYNIFGFDMSYMADRAKERGVLGPFLKCGRVTGQECKYEKKMLSSSALGDNILKFIDVDGRVLIDIMKIIQRDHKLDSFKLDNVAHHFLGMKKNDVHPNDIFRLQKGSSADRKVIAEYCVQDCSLCNFLTMKLEILASNIGMSNVCSVPLSFIFMRGQGIKIFSLVAKECKNEGFLIPTMSRPWGQPLPSEDDDGYEGAIVLEPKTGIYIDDPVCVLDYASLYPSSMISENLSHDCIVIDSKYDNLPGVQYLDISYDLYEGAGDKKVKAGEKVCRFAQLPDNEKGIIPRILQKLLRKRKETRKKAEWKEVTCTNGSCLRGMVDNTEDGVRVVLPHGEIVEVPKECVVSTEDAYDDFQKAVLDGLQVAYKVTANSLYGQVGARTSQIYMKDIAACTTATGRKMIMMARDFILQKSVKFKVEYDPEIVYGDSVAGYTPTVLKVNNKIIIEKIENIAEKYGNNKWIRCIEKGRQEKEGCELQGVLVWTSEGWTELKRVIRHKLAEHKSIIRVLTHTGVVDVTDEHSLLDPQRNKVDAKEVRIGDILLHKDLPELEDIDFNITEGKARIMGMFMGNGSCGDYNCPSGRKTSWAINNSDLELMNEYLHLCEREYPQSSWKILDKSNSSGVYKLVAHNGVYDELQRFFRTYISMLHDGQDKIVPVEILNSNKNIKEAFWKGLYDAEGDKDIQEYIYIDQESQVSAASIFMLATSIGYQVTINIHTEKPKNYRLTMSKASQRKHPDKVKQMQKIDYDGFVYDFTTHNHEFSAGVGRLICHNTDSLFSAFRFKSPEGTIIKGKEAIPLSRELGIAISKEIKRILKPPHDLEYEKIFWPFVLLSKKRYVANKYEMDDVKFKQNSMGIVLKRRDNANIVKKIYGGIIDIILNEQNLQKSIAFLTSSLESLVVGKYPIEDLVITKSLRSDYKDPDKIAHKMLANRIKDRDPGNAPNVNDRIPFVYIKTEEKPKGEKTLQGERIETPEYIRSKGLQPDYEFYITNQVMNPVLQVYALVLDQLPGYAKDNQYWADMYEKVLEGKEGNLKKTNTRIDDLKEIEVKKLLFDPILHRLHPPKVSKTASKVNSKIALDLDLNPVAPQPAKPKRGRKAKTGLPSAEGGVVEAKPKRGRKPKAAVPLVLDLETIG